MWSVWHAELLNIVGWALRCCAITLAIFLLGMVMSCLCFTWGKQFWHINKSIICSRKGITWWSYVVAILFCLILSGRLWVCGSLAISHAVTALEHHDKDAFFQHILFALLLGAAQIPLSLGIFLLEQYLIVYWRRMLTGIVQSLWISHDNFYLFRFLPVKIDNPDQRIDLDTADLAEKSVKLAATIVMCFVNIFQAIQELWRLSVTVSLGGFTVPRAAFSLGCMFIFLIAFSTVIIGQPLIRLDYIQKIFEANYRFSLAKLRVNNKEIALRRSGDEYNNQLNAKFRKIIRNSFRIIHRRAALNLVNFFPTHLSTVCVYVLQGTAFFQHRLSLGDVYQSGNMFKLVTIQIVELQKNYEEFAEYRSTLNRLNEFLVAARYAQSISLIKPQRIDSGLSCTNMSVYAPDNRILVSDLTLTLASGDSLLITGESGVGKSTLLLALASLWPYVHGSVSLPEPSSCVFISQQWYVPEGTLRSLFLTGADDHCHSRDNEIMQMVAKVGLDNIIGANDTLSAMKAEISSDTVPNFYEKFNLDTERDWSQVFSPGQIQRIAIARAILAKPKILFLDESTSALEENIEAIIYQLMSKELPDATIISIAHRSTIKKFHSHELRILPAGAWEFTSITNVIV